LAAQGPPGCEQALGQIGGDGAAESARAPQHLLEAADPDGLADLEDAAEAAADGEPGVEPEEDLVEVVVDSHEVDLDGLDRGAEIGGRQTVDRRALEVEAALADSASHQEAVAAGFAGAGVVGE